MDAKCRIALLCLSMPLPDVRAGPGPVLQRVVTRANGSREMGSAVPLAGERAVTNCHVLRDAARVEVRDGQAVRVALGDVRDAYRDTITQGLGKARVVKNADAMRVQVTRHPARITRSRQRPRDDDPVVARQHPMKIRRITVSQRSCHGHSPRQTYAPHRSSCLAPARPA